MNLLPALLVCKTITTGMAPTKSKTEKLSSSIGVI